MTGPLHGVRYCERLDLLLDSWLESRFGQFGGWRHAVTRLSDFPSRAGEIGLGLAGNNWKWVTYNPPFCIIRFSSVTNTIAFAGIRMV